MVPEAIQPSFPAIWGKAGGSGRNCSFRVLGADFQRFIAAGMALLFDFPMFSDYVHSAASFRIRNGCRL